MRNAFLMLMMAAACGSREPSRTAPAESVGFSQTSLTAGARCSKSQECASGFCLNTGPSKSCVSVCTADADCPSGWTCAVWQGLDAHRHYCEPPSLAWRRRLARPRLRACGLDFAAAAMELGGRHVLAKEAEALGLEHRWGPAPGGMADRWEFDCPALHVAFRRWDAARDPLPADGDAYVFSEFLEHIDGDVAVLRQVPPGAFVCLSVPSRNDTAHVRWFQTLEAVRARYGPLIEEQDAATEAGGKWHWIVGRRRNAEPPAA